MKRNRVRPVLAIGLDAAEPTLIRQLIERDKLPVLKSLLREGFWADVDSTATVGSGTVWPTFFTGREPSEHGVHSEWCWQPETMSLKRYDGLGLAPFWRALAEEGVRVGVLDMPFAPMIGLGEGFEISEWGAHDVFEGRMRFAPESLAPLLVKDDARHPFSSNGEGAGGAQDVEGLKALAQLCLEGARMRGDLALSLMKETEAELSLIIFPEIHHAEHKLWHTVAHEHPFYARDGAIQSKELESALEEILREVDSQIGRLVEAAGEDAAILVFSLHGMRPARGIPAFLQALLCAKGMSRLAGWSTQSWKERTASVFADVKRRMPRGLKNIYHRRLPQAVTHRLAQPTMMPAYDWQRTRAFSLPSDQHGWIRVNLAGRESKGSVKPEDYQKTCLEIEELLGGLKTDDARPLVRDVIRTAKSARDALRLTLPDLVVHWDDAAHELPLRACGLTLEGHPAATAVTGQHAPQGFCILKGHKDPAAPTIRTEEFAGLIRAALALE